MEEYKLLIADTSEEFRHALTQLVHGAYQIRTCKDGKETLEQLQSFRPDILVLDLMLPELDGISILQTASRWGIRPIVLATTHFTSDYIVDSSEQLGVGYLMRKPCDIEATAARLSDLSARLHMPQADPTDYRRLTSELLLSLGVATKLNGYTYLREAIPMCCRNPDQMLTKELYPAVAAVCNAKASHVERSIRNAIEKAWADRDEKVWSQFFQPDADGHIPKPSNALFISRLAVCLRQRGRD